MTLLWQRERSMSRQISGRVSGGTHADMELAAYGLLSDLQFCWPWRGLPSSWNCHGTEGSRLWIWVAWC